MGMRGFAALAAAIVCAAVPAAAPSANAPLSPKLRGDLAALVSGAAALDPKVAGLVPGFQAGELPYFAVLNVANDSGRAAELEALGARVLRSYRLTRSFALASSPEVVGLVADLPWVSWLAPVQLVELADGEEPVGDQLRATTGDVGAPPFWAGSPAVTGAGVRIAVLDTGLDGAHPDLDDLDFRRWSTGPHTPKVVDARNFLGGACGPAEPNSDRHGHGTHVSGIATGTGEGTGDATDNGKYAGIAPDAELAVGKVMTDAGAGLNSDLVAALEWAAMPPPAGPGPDLCPPVGADIVNISLGNESRPQRLNTGSDADLVSLTLNKAAVLFGTLFVSAAGNSGPFMGSVLESPGSAAQTLSVANAAKDFDVNNDNTLSGDTCSGWKHNKSASPGGSFQDNDCTAGGADQPASVFSGSSRGLSGDLRLRPDVAGPGYNIVAPQASEGAALAGNDLNLNTSSDALYATATGTSMASPAVAGTAALLLQAYRQEHGKDPTGKSGASGLKTPAYALLRAALMNTAGGNLYESRWILTTLLASFTLYEVRNGVADPFVGPLAEGAGKVRLAPAIEALRDGIVIHSTASPGVDADRPAGTAPRDLQGSWQIGAIKPGLSRTDRFVLRKAPGAPTRLVGFRFEPGHPSDASAALPASWLRLPAPATVASDTIVRFKLVVPRTAAPGTYTGVVLVDVEGGQTLRVPVLAAVPLHDRSLAEGNAPGPQSRVVSGADFFAKDDTIWPSVVGTPGTGANGDWLVYAVDLAEGLSRAVFTVYDPAARDTDDLYLYTASFDLLATTHPFSAPGVTDVDANDSRDASTAADPETLVLDAPAPGRYYLAVNRARIGGAGQSFGSFVLTLDEIG